jgi:hypothetical protein
MRIRTMYGSGAAAIGVAAVMLLGAMPAAAASQPLSFDQTVNGYTWTFGNGGGSATPTTGNCGDQKGFEIDDAATPTADDAYDSAAVLWVDDVPYEAANNAADVTTDGSDVNVMPAAQDMSGLSVQMRDRVLSRGDVVQLYATFTNTSSSNIEVNAKIAHNWGSDSGSIIDGSSSGDTAFTAADRWLVTSDGADQGLAGGDPVNTTVYYGPGTVAETPTSVGQVVCDRAATNGALVGFDITVPAGESRHLLFFNKISEGTNGIDLTRTNADVVDAASEFDVTPSASNPLFAGIPTSEYPNIVNWAVPQAVTTTTTTAPATTTTAPATTTTVAPVQAQPAFTG